MSLSVFIVGGGASGALLAIRLLRSSLDVQVTLIERSGTIGRGLAYATADEQHVLNVVPSRMSAFADDPDHFSRWLRDRGSIGTGETFVFVPRRLFAEYLDTTLHYLAAGTGRLRILTDEVTSLRSDGGLAKLLLASGAAVNADIVVLATGHETPYVAPCPDAHPEGLPILILGTGLSMVDTWLSLERCGRPIVAMSRHGLLPASHGAHAPAPVTLAEVSLGTTVTAFLRWFRRFAQTIEVQTGDWRPAVDALRPHMQRLWASWSGDSRRRFLRHLKPWWDTRRHRVPLESYLRLKESLASGELQVIAGTALHAEIRTGRQIVLYRRRGSETVESLPVGAVFDCRGLARDWRDRPGSLVSRLVAAGMARIDAVGLGIEVTEDNEVVGADGHAQPNLFAIGPLTRGRWFEIEAVPDIRAQCDRLAAHLGSLMGKQELARNPEFAH